MKNKFLTLVEGDKRDDLPKFEIGDTVDVHQRILEGQKERVQVYSGVVIARRGEGVREMFTVRRIVQGEGVERVFPLHNPRVKDIVSTRRGETRRAKLYFLRDRVGKKTRLREVFGERGEDAAPEAGGPAAPGAATAEPAREPVAAR